MMVEEHARNLATLLRHYNRFTRPQRRVLHGWLRDFAEFEVENGPLGPEYLQQYLDAANLAHYIQRQGHLQLVN